MPLICQWCIFGEVRRTSTLELSVLELGGVRRLKFGGGVGNIVLNKWCKFQVDAVRG